MFSWIQVPDASSVKRVTLKVPFPDVAGWIDPSQRIRLILENTEGILDYTMVYNRKASLYNTTISYDEGKISLEGIIEMHRKEGYEIQGEPEWVKWGGMNNGIGA